MRYPSVGDYWFDRETETVQIRVASMGNYYYESLVAVHELCEMLLCQKRHITNEAIDAFDKEFEANRKEGDTSEPGDAPNSPYKAEHFFATNIERLLAAELGVDWAKYDQTVSSL